MKIILAGDTHGDLAHIATFLFHQADKADADRVFVLGDFGAWEHTSDGAAFMNSLQRRCERRNKTVYWLRGNHDKVSHTRTTYHERDDEGFLLVRPHIRYAEDGHRWTWDGLRFMAFGGAYSVDKGWRLHEEQLKSLEVKRQNRYRKEAGLTTFANEDKSGTLWFPEEEATDNDVDTILLTDSSPVDILLTHDKPRNSNPSWNRKDFPECLPNQDRVTKLANHLTPKLLVHGHLHFFYKDHVYVGGPGNQPASVMAVAGLDADVGRRDESYMVCDLDDLRRIFSEKGVS